MEEEGIEEIRLLHEQFHKEREQEKETLTEAFVEDDLAEFRNELCVVTEVDRDSRWDIGFKSILTGCKDAMSSKKNGLHKLDIGSQFVTTCTPEIYPSGQGEFLVVDKREPKTGDMIFRKFVTQGIASIATIDYIKGTCRWIVVPCDLAYYTKTFNEIAYVMYLADDVNRRIIRSSASEYYYNILDINSDAVMHKFVVSMNLTPVPLSVSAKTGVVAPKAERKPVMSNMTDKQLLEATEFENKVIEDAFLKYISGVKKCPKDDPSVREIYFRHTTASRMEISDDQK